MNNPLSPNGQAALEWARTHGPVFPVWWIEEGRCACGRPNCSSPGKHPMTVRGVSEATRNEGEILDAWMQYPSANIAAATGSASGLWVLDVDAPEALGILQLDQGPLPETLICRTGSGGSHLYFRMNGTRVGNSVRFRPGLDTRGDGGYVLLPPSGHLSGDPYRWLNSNPPAEAPDWLVKLVTERRSQDQAEVHPLDDEGKIPEGRRNATLAMVAGDLRRRGLTPGQLADMLSALNRTACVPPLGEAEVRRIADSIGRRKPGDPLVTPSVDDGEEEETGWTEPPKLDWRLYDLAGLPNVPVPPLEWIVGKLLPKGGIGFLSGAPKDGKSLLALDLAIHLAHGKPWLDRFGVRKTRTLYISREDDLRRLKDRAVEINSSYSYPELPAGWVLFLVRERFNLMDHSHLEWLAGNVRNASVEFLVLDVLNRMVPELDENAAKDMARMVSVLEWLNRELSLTVLCLDHTRKPPPNGGKRDQLAPDPLQLKGSIAKYGCADFMICLARTRQLGRLQLYGENKDADERPHFLVDVSAKGSGHPKFKFAGDIGRMAEASSEAGHEHRKRVYDAMQPGVWMSVSDVVPLVGMKERAVRNHLWDLVEGGCVAKRGSSKQTRYCRNETGEDEK